MTKKNYSIKENIFTLIKQLKNNFVSIKKNKEFVYL